MGHVESGSTLLTLYLMTSSSTLSPDTDTFSGNAALGRQYRNWGWGAVGPITPPLRLQAGNGDVDIAITVEEGRGPVGITVETPQGQVPGL